MVLASVIAGASGGALANVALSPLGGGAGMLQSYWYGAGLILGERDMYTFHWEKIKKRLESGEDYLSVLEGEMTPSITAIANFSLKIMKDTSEIYLREGVDFMAKLIENMLMLLAGETPNIDENAPTIGDPRRPVEPTPTPEPDVQCPAGFRWSASAQQCVPEDIPEPTPTPVITGQTQAQLSILAVGRIRENKNNSGQSQWNVEVKGGTTPNYTWSIPFQGSVAFNTLIEAKGMAWSFWPPTQYDLIKYDERFYYFIPK